jgi:hypothetical protein
MVLGMPGERVSPGRHYKGKHPGGRPTEIVPNVVQEPREAFRDDFTVEEAWRFAGIAKQSYHNACKRFPECLDAMERAQDRGHHDRQSGRHGCIQGNPVRGIR